MSDGILIETPAATAVSAPSFLSLLEAHEELDELFLRHQQALLRRDLAAARQCLETYERGLSAHIRLEEEELLTIYERAGPIRGGAVRLFTAEHRKMVEMAGRCQERLGQLARHPGELSREILQLLDYETMFKHLAEHHDLRERNILYPTLDRVASDEERRELLVDTLGAAPLRLAAPERFTPEGGGRAAGAAGTASSAGRRRR